jgi:hypothetical protein
MKHPSVALFKMLVFYNTILVDIDEHVSFELTDQFCRSLSYLAGISKSELTANILIF